MNPRDLLLGSFAAALAAADPLQIVPRHLPSPPKGRTVVVGAGKAAGAMALAVETAWPADRPLEGVVITRYGHGLPTQRIRVVEAGHPVPDESGERAAHEILALAKSLGEDDLLLVLVSGGGSALLSAPVPAVSMADLKAVTRQLLACGAPIQDMNTVRKHLSTIQGGRLAVASRAQVVALVISDVTGDDPTHIASGPCAPDPTTFADAQEVLRLHGVEPPASIAAHLARGAKGEEPETPKPDDQIFTRVENVVIATAHQSLMTASAFVQARGITPMVLGDSVTGESREVAKVYAALARQIHQHSHPLKRPVALISGGETTVTIRGNGRGGRCTEFLLSLAVDLAGLDHVHALAADTDGIDGSESNAGAILLPDSIARAAALGHSAKAMLADNDGYSFFAALNDLVITGPTRTNVNDFRIILVQ
ncbi:glycerate kinase type-2 family protein [Usitatibacter palustris]|uniref:Hydroxypyruvate reductase n=1 Tax=Usitatibacter palustris TaxID=2732487 RepID=A0A6M4HEA4_9PROT|nr:glycerate kinase [Usitatibacter palustris]QJR16317.1 Putative hydroxypyruvate reductase [Usitatibacter palustris]